MATAHDITDKVVSGFTIENPHLNREYDLLERPLISVQDIDERKILQALLHSDHTVPSAYDRSDQGAAYTLGAAYHHKPAADDATADNDLIEVEDASLVQDILEEIMPIDKEERQNLIHDVTWGYTDQDSQPTCIPSKLTPDALRRLRGPDFPPNSSPGSTDFDYETGEEGDPFACGEAEFEKALRDLEGADDNSMGSLSSDEHEESRRIDIQRVNQFTEMTRREPLSLSEVAEGLMDEDMKDKICELIRQQDLKEENEQQTQISPRKKPQRTKQTTVLRTDTVKKVQKAAPRTLQLEALRY